ncbi:MAG: hypothetical protein QXK11_10320 [Pyrobaculum sp.]|uniref:hypothetical protein n=1 Tax=Pyrobaculum sp. TaxID=2004705 RepID=UPI000FFB0A11
MLQEQGYSSEKKSCICGVQHLDSEQHPKPDLLCLDKGRHVVAVEVTARGNVTDYVEKLRNKCLNSPAKSFIVVKSKVSKEDMNYKVRAGYGRLVEGEVGEPWFLCS